MSRAGENRTVLAFMAHPDDAEFLCAGTLSRLAEAGWEVHIATAAPGDCGTTTETRWVISARRTEEARKAAALIGAAYYCLDERDGFVVYDQPTLRKSMDLFRRVAPSLVLTHAAKDYMMDHEMVSLLARAASFLYAAPNASELPLREGSRVPYLYYCDPVDGLDPLGCPVEPTTLVDISDQLGKKTEMLACHASQREWLRAHHGTDEYLDAMKRLATMRGGQGGVAAAEAFVQHRGHAYPRDDLLAELFAAPKWV
jgi:LmbE family N-acetylglucosaminyl deacetylase